MNNLYQAARAIPQYTNTDKRQMVLTYLRVQSLHASSLLVASSVHSHALAVLHDHVITCSHDVISCSNFMHLSSDSYVDVDACRMWYYEMWFYDGTCDGGRILVYK